MKPSPPNRPTPIFFWNAMPIDTPCAAQRNESFWQISVPPSLRAGPSAGSCRGRARRTPRAARPAPPLVKTVMNRLSPVSRRLPAPSSSPMSPALLLRAAVAEDRLHLDAGRHVHHRAGLGDRALAGIELDLDELHLVAEDLEVDLVRLPRRNRRRRRRRRRAAAEAGGQLRDVLERRPVAHAAGEHQRVPVDRSRLDAPDDLVLADGPDLLPADGHVPLLTRHWILLKGAQGFRAGSAGGHGSATALPRPAYCPPPIGHSTAYSPTAYCLLPVTRRQRHLQLAQQEAVHVRALLDELVGRLARAVARPGLDADQDRRRRRPAPPAAPRRT